MAKTSKKHLSFLFLLVLASELSLAQAKSGVESYNYLTRENEYTWMPVIHYQSAKGMYAELRYNYEDVKTVSLFVGKTFEAGNNAVLSITPMLGLSTGTFKGVSVAANTDIEWKAFYVSTEMQYSFALSKSSTPFFFSWSEAGFNISSNFFAGMALQFTRQEKVNDWQPGLLAGLSFGKLSIPLYVFSPFSRDQYIILGVNYEYQLNKKKKRSKSMYLG